MIPFMKFNDEQTRCGGRNKNGVYLGREDFPWEEAKRVFWDDRNILCIDEGSANLGVYMCKKAVGHTLNTCALLLYMLRFFFLREGEKSHFLLKLLARQWGFRPMKALALMIGFFDFLEDQGNLENAFWAMDFYFCQLFEFCL